MPGVKIVTDSSCDLPDELVESHHIAVVPLTVRFGDEEFVDRVDLDAKEFWARCAAADVLPETSAPSPGAFEQVYREALSEGYDSVVAVMLSGDLSATIQAAEAAARSVNGDIPVQVVDSKTVTMGLGNLVLRAARLAEEGADAQAVADRARSDARRTRAFAALDTLENLRKGGRIGAAQSMLGSLLSIKPIIEVKEGSVVEAGKQRTRARALKFLAEKVRQHTPVESLAVMHADCPDVDSFISTLSGIYDGDIVVGEIGAVIGAHAGPGTMGITFLVSE
ncbi:MAG TPA: DegV family protein [Acidimicrobiales bacterium]|nr:DegV family protein [Acidimicrobiales bacterium]